MLTRSRSSVLGKRTHQCDESSPTKVQCPPTPDLTPVHKRTRISETIEDGSANKENIPPFNTDPLTTNRTSPLRRTATEISLTPTSVRNTPRRVASTSNVVQATPSTALSGLTITPPPTPPTLLQPIYVRVRGCLRPTCDDPQQTIRGRSEERALIQSFISSFLDFAKDDMIVTSLYVSGTPGTGKTALVNSALHGIDTSDVRVVYINCMELKDITSLYDRFLVELDSTKKSGRGIKKAKSREAVEEVLARLDTKCILVLDEVDHIASTTESLVSIFSLPRCNPTTLRMIAIANTHTLTSSLTTKDVDSVRTVHFKSYSPAELASIIEARLESLLGDATLANKVKQFLPTPVITLLTKKIATQTGDVRYLFEVLRGAIDRAVTASNVGSDPLNTPLPIVTPSHVLAALKSHAVSNVACTKASSSAESQRNASEVVTKIRDLGLQPQVVLLLILLAFKRTEADLSLSSISSKSPTKRSSAPSPVSSALDAAQLHAYYVATLTRSDDGVFHPISRSEFNDVLGLLEGVGLLHIALSDSCSMKTSSSPSPSKRRKTLNRSSSFSSGALARVQEVSLADGVRGDEALRGLGIQNGQAPAEVCTDIRMEEVRALWYQESARLAREIKSMQRTVTTITDTFEGAMEK